MTAFRPRRWLDRLARWLGPLEIGAFGPLAVRREAVRLGLPRPVRLLYASDLHLGHWWTRGLPGNHDERPGLPAVRAAVTEAGGRWLSDRPLREPLPIDGEPGRGGTPGPPVLCAHYPDVFRAPVRAGYRLVLAGHLHGGQCVLASVRGRLYPAVWVHRWHGLRFRDGAATLLVSRGAADTFPCRFDCPREVLLCSLE